MNCCSRSTLGIVIGILNVLVYISLTIYLTVFLVNGDVNDGRRNDLARNRTIFIIVIVLCLIMAVIAGLLIMGIVKRRHKLMMPWLILSGTGFIINCGSFLFGFFGALFSGVAFSTLLVNMITSLLAIGISALILWLIFTLYGDIRKENVERPGKIMARAEIEYKAQDSY